MKEEPEDLDSAALEEIGHPKGTLVIVLLYGALFVLGWVLLYFGEFLPRGATP
jgi:hypothetical protein